MYSFKKIDNKYSEIIKDLWVSSLPKNIYSIFGKGIIQIYLNYYFKQMENNAFGVFKKNKMIGFVLYGLDNKINDIILKRHFFQLFKEFIKSILKNFKNIFLYIDVILFYLFFNLINIKGASKELLIICVDEQFTDKGIGSKLINYSINQLTKECKIIIVKTLTKNYKNINFYKKNSFKIISNKFGRTWFRRKIN